MELNYTISYTNIHYEEFMKRNLTNLQIILLGILLIALGCNFSVKPHYYDDDIKLAEKEAKNVIANINDKNVDELYKNAHPKVKETKTKEKLKEVIDKMQELFGKIKKYELSYSKVKTINVNERMVHLLYKSEFEKGENVLHLEIVTNDEEAKLYSINLIESSQFENVKKELEKQ